MKTEFVLSVNNRFLGPDDQFNLRTIKGKEGLVAKVRDKDGNKTEKVIVPDSPDAVRFATKEEAEAKVAALGLDPKTVRVLEVNALADKKEE